MKVVRISCKGEILWMSMSIQKHTLCLNKHFAIEGPLRKTYVLAIGSLVLDVGFLSPKIVPRSCLHMMHTAALM